MKDLFKLTMALLLGVFSFASVGYVVFLAVTMVLWMIGAV